MPLLFPNPRTGRRQKGGRRALPLAVRGGGGKRNLVLGGKKKKGRIQNSYCHRELRPPPTSHVGRLKKKSSSSGESDRSERGRFHLSRRKGKRKKFHVQRPAYRGLQSPSLPRIRRRKEIPNAAQSPSTKKEKKKEQVHSFGISAHRSPSSSPVSTQENRETLSSKVPQRKLHLYLKEKVHLARGEGKEENEISSAWTRKSRSFHI